MNSLPARTNATHQRRCPKCKSGTIVRSRARNPLEAVVKLLLNRRAYRCWSCNERFLARVDRA
jgi:hypothetical protein